MSADLDEESRRLLALADDFARIVIERAAPVRFAVARTPALVEAIFRLRCRTVIESGWADSAGFPDGLERDGFDRRAVQVGGWDDQELVACARLVFPEPGLRLPVEQGFEVALQPQGRVVEVGRVIVAPRYRTEDRRVFIGVLASCWLELRARGFHVMCGDAAEWLIQAYRLMGFVVSVIGDGREYWGEHRYPIVIDGLASVLTTIRNLGEA